MSRTKQDYTNALQKVFEEVSFSKYKIIGSANLKAIRYPSDYDVNDDVSINRIDAFIKRLKWIFNNAKRDPDYFITDFKAGKIGDEPIRWKFADIMKGTKSGVSLKEALKMDATIKLDLVILVDNKVTEVTTNFFIGKAPPGSLKENIRELVDEGEWFKALKRTFSLNETRGKSNKKLLAYFNSDVGLLNKVKSDILTLISLLEQTFKKVDIDIIRHNIQLIKYELSGIAEINISSMFDEMMRLDKKTLIKKLQKVAYDILEEVNLDARKSFKKLTD